MGLESSAQQKQSNVRALAAGVIAQVLRYGCSLTTSLQGNYLTLAESDRSLLQSICFGVLRNLPRLEWYLQQLMSSSLARKRPEIHALLLVGCYQLAYTRVPGYAAINETVAGASLLKGEQFKGLVNGVLRQFLRQKDLLTQASNLPDEPMLLHPSWLLRRLQQAYPNSWQSIVEQNNRLPPLWLRVNLHLQSREEYLEKLRTVGIEGQTHPEVREAILLQNSVPVAELPGFATGAVTIQDLSAQYAASLLAPRDGEMILDLCSAPGGKASHILEYAPKARLLAVDNDPKRLDRTRENLARLGLRAELICGDATIPKEWAEGRLFDRILLDAPCSATGIIRRHPDIKWLRRSGDIPWLAAQQMAMLRAVWPYLKPGGLLLYATCSVLPEENSEQVARFLLLEPSALLEQTVGEKTIGWQLLPDSLGGDGFFYAKLRKLE